MKVGIILSEVVGNMDTHSSDTLLTRALYYTDLYSIGQWIDESFK